MGEGLPVLAHCSGCKRGYVSLARDGARCLACGEPVYFDEDVALRETASRLAAEGF